MAITASDIHNQSFSIDRKGYDVDEVDVFLEHVADEIDILNDTIAQLQAQLEEDRFSGFDAPAASTVAITETVAASVDTAEYDAQLAQKDAIIADLERQLNDKRADDNAIAQALIIAQRSADEILAKANANATETIQDARDEAQRIIDRANTDRQDVIDAIRKLQDDREDAREEYADLLKDIISDASRKLADIGANVPAAAAAAGDGEYDVAAGLTGNFEIDEYVAPSSYVTPAAPAAAPAASAGIAVAAATPVASAYEKDLSGFGDADDFEFEEID
ncbi:DivIVA domain-containing protein [Adlercreutzia caecimuris]|jgi:cell division initiation protein|uniref:Cell wall synthesis protein Wag31 n=2 Tax=Adlercreutzia caecimuris TaxID=671266 RepID=R9KVD4_9ACTN|nr:DivIVA domain-containing protein [Adlercreutzia caecimuris]EOS50524.1 DivIVA domain-containing protein [Adlercreutzia caecimuris B7]MCI9208306.1 DivIVA domain-containing protein [Adlercreutzia caecimuris]NBJ67516.1 DivIVA domain-containing protein [Adlercreutzia caecimuris]THG36644.1 DivIVA domain-containing protein [Adlercreutzia caecimuris]